mmetsp:Transcript_25288/g.22300  ORF Transcript_25288/g.22300 Transcript_25288/m.22300 type:complete len:140 (-) Transcript_25288:542-961(-)
MSKNVDYKTLAQDTFEAINEIRKTPQMYMDALHLWKTYYHDKTLEIPKMEPLETIEGKEPVLECINYLNDLQPIAPFKWCDKLAAAAADHCKDIGTKGTNSHTGSDGSDVGTRAMKKGASKYAGESISLFYDTPQHIIT